MTFESVDGTDIVTADYRGCSPKEFVERLGEVRDWVVRQPTRSVLMITLAAGVGYDPTAMRVLVAILRETKPFMLASAVVGLGHLTLLIRVINHLAAREVQAFESLDHAKRWLVATADRLKARHPA